MSAAEQMKMQVIHCLATIIAGVDDDSVAFAQLLLRAILAAADIKEPNSAQCVPPRSLRSKRCAVWG